MTSTDPTRNLGTDGYVHGYLRQENDRLRDQADVLAELIHGDIAFPTGSRVLEVGCGVGAQTVTLVGRSPGARFTAIDVSAASLAEAARRAGTADVEFVRADVHDLPFEPGSFDHVVVCFVLEHLPRPEDALRALRRVVRPGGTITVVEGDHGSAYFHPDSAAARAVIESQVTLQRLAGGDALIGRRMRPLLVAAGFVDVEVVPRTVYVDASRPDLVDAFIRRTFTAMIEGVRGPAVAAGLLDPDPFDAGIRDLHRTAEPDGVFCYTFFAATAVRG